MAPSRHPRIFEGAEIDGFTLGTRLEVGGMASIWRAARPGIDFPIVLKFPFLTPGEDVSSIVAFEIEEMILKRLAGPHVPAFVASGDLDRLPYVAMEFVAGETLQTLAEAAPLPAAEITRVGVALCHGLESLHRQKVIHLDLKPRNVIMAARGAVLIDFGLARHLELPDLLGEASGKPMGSPATIAPEQIYGARDNPASDVFALGCILYQLATGDLPFGEPLTRAGMEQRVHHAPPPPRARNPRLPLWLEDIIAHCLEVDPARRYPSAASVAADLNHPEQVRPRRRTTAPSGFLARLGSLFGTTRPPDFAATARSAPREATLVLAAVDLSPEQKALAGAIRDEAARVMAYAGHRRLTCIAVLRPSILGEDRDVDAEGRLVYLTSLLALREWARPLGLGEDRASFHVLEALDVGRALLDFILHNHVDHAIVGARGASALRRHLGSVSARVVAEAPCTVTVVRLPTWPAEVEAAAADQG